MKTYRRCQAEDMGYYRAPIEMYRLYKNLGYHIVFSTPCPGQKQYLWVRETPHESLMTAKEFDYYINAIIYSRPPFQHIKELKMRTY